MNRFLKGLLIAGVAIAVAAGCSNGIIRPKVEQGIADALPQYIGPAKDYKVTADGSTTDILNGLIKHLHIEGRDVEIDPSLTIKNLTIDVDEVRYNHKRELTSVGKTVFAATVGEDDINRFIETTEAADYNPKVKLLSTGQAEATLVPRVLSVNVAVSITGKPEIVGRDRVNFVADKSSVARLPVPAFAINKVLDSFNPIVDMSLIGFPVRISGVGIKKHTMVVRGEADFKPSMVGAK